MFPVLEREKILSLVNQYRNDQENPKPPLKESEFSCQMAKKKLSELWEEKEQGLEVGGSNKFLPIENNQGYYAFNYIKNVANENQVLFWWNQSLEQNDILITTNYQGVEIEYGCVATFYQPNSSLAVMVISSK